MKSKQNPCHKGRERRKLATSDIDCEKEDRDNGSGGEYSTRFLDFPFQPLLIIAVYLVPMFRIPMSLCCEKQSLEFGVWSINGLPLYLR